MGFGKLSDLWSLDIGFDKTVACETLMNGFLNHLLHSLFLMLMNCRFSLL
jgi:hypothetical protein